MQRALTLAAVVLMTAGCRSEPVDTQALLTAHSVGLSNLQRGQLAEAEQQFKTVVQVAPKDATGHANLGLTYLRGSRFKEAERELERARDLNPSSVEIGLTLAKLYAVTERAGEARKLLEQYRSDPRATYALAEMEADSAARGDTASARAYEQRLREVLAKDPANIAVRLQLADALARNAPAPPDSVLQQLEEVRRLPEPPPEVKPHLDSALTLLRAGKVAEGRGPLDRFLHLMELTAPYQAALEKVKWVEGPLVGRPILTFNPQTLITTRGLLPVGRKAEVSFVDVTAEVGLSETGMRPTALALGDYDGNGSDNLVVSLTSTSGRAQSATKAYNILRGYVAEATAKTGISLLAGARNMTFADFDNDGWLDLFAIGNDGRGYLLRNDGTGKFVDVTSTARVGDTGDARKALFVDLDHDGDLDLVLVGGATRVYRNNLDGTFTDVTLAMGFNKPADDAAVADFDGDGRIDVVTASGTGITLYRNTGFQRFEDVTASAGISSAGDAAGGRLAVADYNNDGLFDILAVIGRGVFVWRNQGGGHFARDSRAELALKALQGASIVKFADYDNDGWLDVFALGRRGGGGGVLLFHNDHDGKFSDQSRLLPRLATDSSDASTFAISDIDGDGDQDLLVGDAAGVHLLRNTGGNARLAMQVQLTGLRTGSGKNNTFGIGSKIEMRAGELFETRVVTDRVTHFGLGPHLKADVLRVEWTNGVPQTIYFPGTDQDILELEQLKGSCAFLYTWDGTRFRFITDVMWRSAFGMPLGIMGGAKGATYAPAGASQEYLRISGDALQPRNGRYTLQLTEELWETAFLDQVRLIAVDHPDSVDVFVDERFVPPGPVTLRTFNVVQRHPPLSAVDDRGNDVLPALREHDNVYVSNLAPVQYQGLVEPHDLIMDLGADAGAPGTYLFLRGWIYPTDASINVALSQRSRVAASLPSLDVRNAGGEWVIATPNIGFPSGKDKTIVIDLAGKFPTNDHRVRIRTNMQIYWDQAFVARDAATSPLRTTALSRASADLHYRGFSRMYRLGGPHGPHWFAYDDVSKTSPWRPIVGSFTRFGDVSRLLDNSDDMYVIMAPGDEATVEFDAASAPVLPKGWTRTFLLYTDGWIKDSDLNTAYGNSVEPLPFHAIKQYPYADGERYPTDSMHVRYRREFNKRSIGAR